MQRRRAAYQSAGTKHFGTPSWFTRREVFSPESLSGLVLWLAADDAATLYQTSSLDTPATSDGDPVGGWKNRAAGAYPALQATSSRRPLLRLGALNGRPMLEFDGADDYLAVTRMTSQFAAGLSYFLVLKFADGRPASTRRPFGARTSVPVQAYFTTALSTGGNLSHATWIDTTNYEGVFLNYADGETPWHVLSAVAAPGDAVTTYLDGVESASTSISAGTWSHIAGAISESPFLGADNLIGSPAGPHSLRLAEVLIYGTPLGATDRAAVENYLAAKYGLS